MILKQDEVVARALRHFLTIISDPQLLDEAVLSRGALTIKALIPFIETTNTRYTGGIGLSGLHALELVSQSGDFNDDNHYARVLGFDVDRSRLTASELFPQYALTPLQNLILDSAIFDAIYKTQMEPEYHRLTVNHAQLVADDDKRYFQIKAVLNNGLRALMAEHILPEFEGEQLSPTALTQLNEAIVQCKRQACKAQGIIIPERVLTEAVPKLNPSSFCPKQSLQRQEVWFDELKKAKPCQTIYQAAEESARLVLLGLQQRIQVQAKKEGGWQVGWKVWAPLDNLRAADSVEPYHIRRLVEVITQGLTCDKPKPTHFQSVLVAAEKIITDYQPSQYSSKPSTTFFEREKKQMATRNRVPYSPPSAKASAVEDNSAWWPSFIS